MNFLKSAFVVGPIQFLFILSLRVYGSGFRFEGLGLEPHFFLTAGERGAGKCKGVGW